MRRSLDAIEALQSELQENGDDGRHDQHGDANPERVHLAITLRGQPVEDPPPPPVGVSVSTGGW